MKTENLYKEIKKRIINDSNTLTKKQNHAISTKNIKFSYITMKKKKPLQKKYSKMESPSLNELTTNNVKKI